MPELVVMCGLAGSGKSEHAKREAEMNNMIICSSDSLREELYDDVNNQENNNELFTILHRRIKNYLKEGKSVIYDACNINSRRRRAFLSELKNIPCEKTCMIMATPFKTCCERNDRRERSIPYKEIKKMYLSWQTPYWFEGWNNIITYYDYDNSTLKNPYKWILDYMEYDQCNHNHTLTLGEHCQKVASILRKYDMTLYYAGKLHDCGKPFTKGYKDINGKTSKEAHYYSHDNVGAYESLFFDYSGDVKQLDVSVLINYHMYPYFWEKDIENGKKTEEKYRKLWGEKMFNNIMILHEADVTAH
jgi:predicted kinase